MYKAIVTLCSEIHTKYVHKFNVNHHADRQAFKG
jgi:hypothetical protein